MALLFLRRDVAASLTNSALDLAGYTGETVWYEPHGGSYSSVTVMLSSVVTAGQLTVDVRKDGIKVTPNVVLAAGESRESVTLSVGVVAGSQLSVVVTTTSTWAPTTNTVLVLLE